MNKSLSIIFGGLVVFVLVIAGVGLTRFNSPDAKGGLPETGGSALITSTINNPKNTSYIVEGETITLTNGKFEREAAPGSASKEKFMLFGEPTSVDLDGDGDLDAVSYLTKNSGGSGTFFYVVAAINSNGEYKGTNAMLLGDRISPQNITVEKNNAVANFAERKVGEPFTTQPSVGKSVWVHFDAKSGEIGELAKDFEGEADASTMTLTMKKWSWIKTNNSDGTTLVPKKADVFTLTFEKERFSVTTDCNSVGGEYSMKNNSLTFDKMMSTMMFCEGSQEQEFSSMLGNVESYSFTSMGELVLKLKDGKSNVTFR